MTRTDCYRRLFARLGDAEARSLINRLQVLALTQPQIVKELEAFLGRETAGDQRPSEEIHAPASHVERSAH